MKLILGSFFVFAGLIAVAGAGGDCDGRCMEMANSTNEFLIAIGLGLILMITGAVILINNQRSEK